MLASPGRGQFKGCLKSYRELKITDKNDHIIYPSNWTLIIVEAGTTKNYTRKTGTKQDSNERTGYVTTLPLALPKGVSVSSPASTTV